MRLRERPELGPDDGAMLTVGPLLSSNEGTMLTLSVILGKADGYVDTDGPTTLGSIEGKCYLMAGHWDVHL
eukprot:scaffold36910_cov33-Attheya_sp.AAC.3